MGLLSIYKEWAFEILFPANLFSNVCIAIRSRWVLPFSETLHRTERSA